MREKINAEFINASDPPKIFQVCCKIAKKTPKFLFNLEQNENPKAKTYLMKTHPENALIPGLGFEHFFL